MSTDTHVIRKPVFDIGLGTVTPAASKLLGQFRMPVEDLLARHMSGDWGDVSEVERKLNEEHLQEGLCLLSAYMLSRNGRHARVLVFTEADRSITTVMLPEEY